MTENGPQLLCVHVPGGGEIWAQDAGYIFADGSRTFLLDFVLPETDDLPDEDCVRFPLELEDAVGHLGRFVLIFSTTRLYFGSSTSTLDICI